MRNNFFELYFDLGRYFMVPPIQKFMLLAIFPFKIAIPYYWLWKIHFMDAWVLRYMSAKLTKFKGLPCRKGTVGVGSFGIYPESFNTGSYHKNFMTIRRIFSRYAPYFYMGIDTFSPPPPPPSVRSSPKSIGFLLAPIPFSEEKPNRNRFTRSWVIVMTDGRTLANRLFLMSWT